MRDREKRAFARLLRKRMTDAERLIWSCLRNGRFKSLKFRRQYPMGPYVADFCSVKARLVIEIDGGQHQSNQVLDLVRSGFMEKKGYRVVRIWNHEVLTELEAVLEELDRTLTALTLDPLIDVPTHKSGRVAQSCQFNGIDPHKWERETNIKLRVKYESSSINGRGAQNKDVLNIASRPTRAKSKTPV